MDIHVKRSIDEFKENFLSSACCKFHD